MSLTGTDKMAQNHLPTPELPSPTEKIPSPPWVHQLVIALGASAVTLAVQGLGLLQLMEWSVLDQWFRLRPAEHQQVPVVVVTIDDDDIAEIGNWPLTDQQLAQFLTRLDSHSPTAIGLNLYRNIPVEPGEADLQQIFTDTPHLIGVEKIISEGASTAIPPAPTLRSLGQVAFNDLVLDSDGHIRRHLVSMRTNQEIQLALGTRLALLHLEKQFQITPEGLKNSRIRLGKTELAPLDSDAGAYVQTYIGGFQVLANYFRPVAEMPTVSFQDVLANRLPAETFKDAVVLVGLKADSTWGDRFYTPFSNSSDETWSGVEIQAQLTAQLIASALTGRAPLRSLPELAEWLWILSWASIGVVCNRNLLINRKLLRLPLFIGVLIGGTYSLFLLHYWIPLLAPLLALQAAWLGTQGYLVWHRLRSENRILELAVQDRTQQLQAKNKDLDQARIAAEQASYAKGMFLAHMSHELRTPLTAILGFSDLLERSPDLPEEESSYVETIKRCGNHLLTIINNVLELSRMEAEAAELNVVPVHLPTFFAEMEYMFQAQARSKQLNIACHLKETLADGVALEWVEVDETKLRQIIINLLGNAIKFTMAGHVHLTATLFKEDPKERSKALENQHPAQRLEDSLILKCAVEDTGPGLSDSEIEQLFQSFVQTSAGKKLGKGTGLGLSLVSQWTQLMGGTIDVCSTVSKGSCFTFQLPVVSVTAPETVPEAMPEILPEILPESLIERDRATPSSQLEPQLEPISYLATQEITQADAISELDQEVDLGISQTIDRDIDMRDIDMDVENSHPRILIVDDEDDNRRLLTHWLSEASFEIETAETGIAALEKAESWHPHIILLDEHLPDYDGYEVVRRIRQQEGNLNHQLSSTTWTDDDVSPIILALTAGVLEEHYTELLEAGCDDVLWKPIRIETLFSKVSEYLQLCL